MTHDDKLIEAVARAEKAERFIANEGFRRCDIMACNCGSWHGGSASQRLHEIRELMEEHDISTNGETIYSALEKHFAALRAVREWQQKQYDEYAMKLMDEGYQFIKTTYDEKTGAIKTEYLTKDEVFKAQPPQEGKQEASHE
jgi:hypothetical protein